METKKVTLNDVKGMTLVQLNEVLDTNKSLTTVMKQAINVRIKGLTPEVPSPVETIQEGIAAEATTTEGTLAEGTQGEEAKPEPEVIVIAKVEKNKPGETTRTIEKFTDDTKGIRAGKRVTFLENNKPGAKTLAGLVQRVFDFYGKRDNRQEVKIKGDNGQRYYRFEKDITPEVITPAVTDELEDFKNGIEPEVKAPEAVEEPKA
jgi:hypothetical protein